MQLLKCKHSNQYKGIKAPKCCGGNPCVACVEKFNGAKLSFHAKSILAKPEDIESVLANALRGLNQQIDTVEEYIYTINQTYRGEYPDLIKEHKLSLKRLRRWRKLALAMADVVECERRI